MLLGLWYSISVMLARLWLPSSSFWYLPEHRRTGSDLVLSALPEQRKNRGNLGITYIYGSVAQWASSSGTWLELDCRFFSVFNEGVVTVIMCKSNMFSSIREGAIFIIFPS